MLTNPCLVSKLDTSFVPMNSRWFTLPSRCCLPDLNINPKLLATVSLSVGVATDFLIALALCYFLRKLRSGFKKSDSLVNMLCVYAINTGLATRCVHLTPHTWQDEIRCLTSSQCH